MCYTSLCTVNQDLLKSGRNGPLAHPLAPLTRSLAPHCSLVSRSAALNHSLAHSFLSWDSWISEVQFSWCPESLLLLRFGVPFILFSSQVFGPRPAAPAVPPSASTSNSARFQFSSGPEEPTASHVSVVHVTVPAKHLSDNTLAVNQYSCSTL